MRLARYFTSFCLATLGLFCTFAQAPADALQSGTTGDLGAADSFVNFTNGAAANICVNTYAIDTRHPDSLYACCSTLATSSQLYSQSARHDIILNTNIPDPPPSLQIKLVATTPASGVCNAGTASAANLVSGLQVTLAPTGGVPFQPAQFAAAPLASACTFLQENGGGVGLCKSAQPAAAAVSSDQDLLFLLLIFH